MKPKKPFDLEDANPNCHECQGTGWAEYDIGRGDRELIVEMSCEVCFPDHGIIKCDEPQYNDEGLED